MEHLILTKVTAFTNSDLIFHPWYYDTDLDWLSDCDEAGGTEGSDGRLRRSLDKDGTEDSNDLDPTGNAYFKFEFSRAAIMSGCTKGDGSGNAHK